MSTFVHALAFLPALAAIIFVLAALADRRDASDLQRLCALDEPANDADDLERSAA